MYTANNSVCRKCNVQSCRKTNNILRKENFSLHSVWISDLLLLEEFVALEVRDGILMFVIVYCLVYRIGVAEKGYIMVQLSVHTSAGHSSMPPRESSIGILANAVTK